MSHKNTIKLFNDKEIRAVWDEEKEDWYFSVIDVINVLTESKTPKRYWSDLKSKLIREGNQTYENIVRLKLPSTDGKMRLTDVVNIEQILRAIKNYPN